MTRISPYKGGLRPVRTVAGTDLPIVGGMKNGVTDANGNTRVSEYESLFDDRTRQFNASSKKELMAQINHLFNQYANGGIQTRYAHTREEAEERLAALREAAADRSGESLQLLGEVIAEEIWETMNREGFTRKVFAVRPLGKGETGRIRLRQKDVVAFQVTTDGNTIEQIVRQPYLYPEEFYLTAFILIENRELEQASTDLLDEKYQDGLENIMVVEDRLTKQLFDAAASVVNSSVVFNAFTPAVFANLRTQITGWNLPVPTAIMAYDLWNDIIADPDFTSWYDPVTKHELVLEGKLGSLLDVELITDAFRHETFQVLDQGEVYFLAPPIALGAVTQRKEVTAEAINQYNVGRPARGWFMEQEQGQVLANARGVAKGMRA